jgi:hypothetical protein
VIGHAQRHGWRGAQRLMYTAEIAVADVKAHGGGMVGGFFSKSRSSIS